MQDKSNEKVSDKLWSKILEARKKSTEVEHFLVSPEDYVYLLYESVTNFDINSYEGKVSFRGIPVYREIRS